MLFQGLKEKIEKTLSPLSPVIEHIGSTSVQGLAAKDVIDIAVGVKSLEDLDKCIIPMMENQFIYFQLYNESMPLRRLFVALRSPEDISKFRSIYRNNGEIDHEGIQKHRISNIHIWVLNSPEWKRHLAFRDFLRKHPKIKVQYAALKKRISKKEYQDTMDYNKEKNDFIKKTERKALEWLKDP